MADIASDRGLCRLGDTCGDGVPRRCYTGNRRCRELERAVALAREMRASGVAVTLVVHEHKRLRRGIELAGLAEQLKAAGIGLEFLTGELEGSHDPSGIVFTVLAGLSAHGRAMSPDS